MDNRSMVFTVGLICGAAIGAAVGLLYAPKAGDATRRDSSGTPIDSRAARARCTTRRPTRSAISPSAGRT